MHDAFFGFTSRPFPAAPQAERYFPAASHERARLAIARAIERAEGPGLLIGRPGLGKSLLLQVLAKEFRSRFKVALLASARLVTRKALLQNILFELGLPYRDLEEGELRLRLIDHLAPGPQCPEGMLLLLDEGHTLPARLLEEVRMLTNLVRNGQPRVRMVITGGVALEERFADPRLTSLSQRVAVRAYLEPFTRDETARFIEHELTASGGHATIFMSDAARTVHTATDGIPRLISQLCDHALLLAAEQRTLRVSSRQVEESWADLQQMPAPVHVEAQSQSEATIEFGELDEEPEAYEPAPEFAAEPVAEFSAEETPATELVTEAASEVIAEESIAPRFEYSSLSEIDARLETVTQQVELVSQEWTSESLLAMPNLDFVEPTLASDSVDDAAHENTEVEICFGEPLENPFAEPFVEEEVLLDPYAALDALGSCQRVFSAEGRELAAMLRMSVAPVPRPALHIAAPETSTTEIELDVVNPPREGAEPTIDIVRPPLSVVGGETAPDDRDILVIEEDGPPGPHDGRARRQEYRQLFARLRRV